MLKKKVGTVILVTFIVCLSLFLFNSHENETTRKIKKSLQKELVEWINTDAQDHKLISGLANIQWDWMCVSSHYTTGKEVAQRFFYADGHNLNISSFSIDDETLLDDEYALSFISLEKKIMISIRLKDVHVSPVSGKKVCMPVHGLAMVLSSNKESEKKFLSFVKAEN